MMEKLWNRFNDLSIKYKLLSSYLLLIAIPLGLFLVVNTITTSRETERQALFSARRLLSQTKSHLDLKTENVRNSLNYIALNDTVKELITRQPQVYLRDIGLWNVDSAKLTRVFLAYKSTDIASIHLYMKQGLAAVFQNEDFLNLNQITATAWYRKLISGSDFVRWYPQQYFSADRNDNHLYALRNISSEQNLFESIGVLKAVVPQQVFRTILDQAVFTKTTSTVLINKNQEIICSSTGSRFQTYEPIGQIITSLKTTDFDSAIWQKVRYEHEKVLVGAQNIKKSDWILLTIIPYRDITALSVKSNQRMILIFLVITFLTVPLAFFIAGSATRRLQQLTHQIRRIETGEFAATVPAGSNDEIGKLTRNFNYMQTRIAALLEEKYYLGQEIKNLELKALQAQINPHFLYNTLDLINWMAVRTNTPEISRVVEALSKFYRLSLNKGDDTITIANELEHVRAYVEIQNMRFDHCIQLVTDIPPEIREYKMLKLVLQPLVENSIIHGILEKDQESGVIQITGELDAGTIRLYVTDDGVGMRPEKAARMLMEISTDEHHGYGVKNIHERIQLNYGTEYGLSYQSEPDNGTKVTITIPARQ
ncbi:MAG TPA: sensor histidine kinase [Bacillota bacterium]|nr:sensor histidine kinase [Bacillota bacterium]